MAAGAGARNGDLKIVDFSPDLATAFKNLNIEWLERYFRVEPVDERVLSNPESDIIARGGAVLFAAADERVIGTVALKPHANGVYELTKMAVTESAQGAGAGKALLAAAIDRYLELDGTRLFLESHSSLAAALYLYENAGFFHVDRPSPSDYERSDVYMVWQPEKKKS